MLNSEIFQTLMHRSCHLERTLDIEIGVEYRKIFVVVFSSCCCEIILGQLQGIQKRLGDLDKKYCRAIHPSFGSSKKQKSK